MPKWKEGDVVRVVTREVTDEDRKANRYFKHMAGLRGTVTNVYTDKRYAVNIDLNSVGPVVADVHKVATQRMRDRFANAASEEQKKALTKEELEFTPNYVLLVEENDLEKV
jgi:hypothetical protein